MIDLIRRKVKLNQPYAGIFLKKNDDDESEVVDKLSDIYSHGSFVQIQEMQDLGDKLRLVVIAHRRIKITNQLFEDPVTEPKKKGNKSETLQMLPSFEILFVFGSFSVEMTIKFPMLNATINVTTADEVETDADRRRRKHKRNKKDTRPVAEREQPGDEPKRRPLAEGEQQPVLMVEVENIKAEQFKQTEEIKALTQEVIKTIRDIISMNPLYRESLQQMLHQNQRVVDNPVYLCDLGASLSAADPAELQAILEEEDVSVLCSFRFVDLIRAYLQSYQKTNCNCC